MSNGSPKPPGSTRGRTIPTSSSPTPRAESAHSISPSRASVTARLAQPVSGSPIPSGTTSRAENIRGNGTHESQTPLAGASAGSVPGPGTSSLSQALRGSFGGDSPTRLGSQRHRSGSNRFKSPERQAFGSDTPDSLGQGQLGKSPRQTEDIEVLKRHLVNPSQAGSEAGSFRPGANLPAEAESIADNEDFSSLQLQGGDTTRHIYRYAEKKEREQAESEDRAAGRLRRSLSVSMPTASRDVEEEGISSIQVPGGLRRDYLRRTAGSPAPSSTHHRSADYGSVNRAFNEPARPKPQFIANNFIEFLTLYGHFAGESLDEDDEVLGPDEYFSSDAAEDTATDRDEDGSDDGQRETSALLTPGKRRRKRKALKPGSGTPIGAAMLLLKSFVGTGVLFLPRAFLNGGMLFSNLVLLFIAMLSYYCFILLVNTRLKVHASFGDMGGIIYGKWFRSFINFSLVLSQVGFASAYIVFVSENLQAFILAVSNCRTNILIQWVILMQMIIFLPLSLYRNINHIQKLALVADLFILLGLLYLYFFDIKTIVAQGGISDVKAFNPKDWTLFIGTAIFTFEGIGLVIPIQSGMKDPKKFPKVLGIVMVIITVVFISMGALSYAAFGSKTKTVVLLNMPQDNKFVNSVQFIYSLAILLSTPLQIYPAIEITSQQLFSKTGKYNPWIKWQKNLFRFFMVMMCAGIAWAGAGDLDKFVALVGSFACIPLVFIYPPLMHYRVISTRTWERVTDISLVIFGFIIMGYTTALTISSWVNGHQESSPGYCDGR